MVEQQLREKLRLAVTHLPRNGEVIDGFFGHGGATFPASDGGNAGDKEEEGLVHGGEGEVYEVAHAVDVGLEGGEHPIEVDGPLVIWTSIIQWVAYVE